MPLDPATLRRLADALQLLADGGTPPPFEIPDDELAPLAREVERLRSRGAALPEEVLVVEDEAATRLLLEAQLQSLGCRVRLAASGAEALARLAEAPTDALLIDLGLPDMDGAELARRILVDAPAPPPRIFAMSSSTEAKDTARSREAGMTGPLAKPLTPQRLREALTGGETRSPTDDAAGAAPLLDPRRLTDTVMELGAVWIERLTLTAATSISEAVERIQRAVGEEHPDELIAGAHKLKGAAANAGLERLRRHAAELERAARAGEAKTVAHLYPTLDALAKQSLEALAAWKKRPKGA